MQAEAEMGLMQPQAKEHLEPPETGIERKDSSQSLGREHSPAGILISAFWPAELRGNNLVLSHQVCGDLLCSHRKLIQWRCWLRCHSDDNGGEGDADSDCLTKYHKLGSREGTIPGLSPGFW